MKLVFHQTHTSISCFDLPSPPHPLRNLTPSSTPLTKGTDLAAQSLSSPGGQSHLKVYTFHEMVIRSNFMMTTPSCMQVFYTANTVIFVTSGTPCNSLPEMSLHFTGEKTD